MPGVLELLIEAVNRNTEALNALAAAQGAAPAADKKATTGKTTSTKPKADAKPSPKHTKAEATEVVVTVKEKLGVDAAKALLANHGFKKVADLTEDKFDAVFEEGTALLDGADGDAAAEDNDI